jgi:hypothetical protein
MEINIPMVRKKYKGKLVKVIDAGVNPSPEDIQKYYKITTHDKFYKTVMRRCENDRVVLEMSDGEYVIIPMHEKTVAASPEWQKYLTISKTKNTAKTSYNKYSTLLKTTYGS